MLLASRRSHFLALKCVVVILSISVLHFANCIEFCTNGYFHPGCLPNNCTRDFECRQGSPGPFSRCRIEFSRCECFDRGRSGIALNNTCLPVRTGGDLCTSHNECKSIRGQSACLGLTDYGIQRGICGCPNPRDYYHEGFNECLRLRDSEGTPCHVDLQCSDTRALGSLAICSPRNSRCRCWDTEGNGSRPAGWHAGRCYLSKAENESCDLREECVIGFHPNADCLVHESYRNESVCTCPENEICREAEVNPKDAALHLANSATNYKLSLNLIFFTIIVIHNASCLLLPKLGV